MEYCNGDVCRYYGSKKSLLNSSHYAHGTKSLPVMLGLVHLPPSRGSEVTNLPMLSAIEPPTIERPLPSDATNVPGPFKYLYARKIGDPPTEKCPESFR